MQCVLFYCHRWVSIYSMPQWGVMPGQGQRVRLSLPAWIHWGQLRGRKVWVKAELIETELNPMMRIWLCLPYLISSSRYSQVSSFGDKILFIFFARAHLHLLTWDPILSCPASTQSTCIQFETSHASHLCFHEPWLMNSTIYIAHFWI